MIAALLLAPALALADPRPPAAIDGYPIGGIGRQALPTTGCAAYLFSTGDTRTLVAMATAQPGTLRLALDGTVRDYTRTTGGTLLDLGFADETRYAAGDTAATLSMTVARRTDLAQGAIVTDATLVIERAGRDGIVIPLAGMIGCAG